MIEQDKKPVIKAVAYEVRHEPEDEYDFGYSETRYRLVNMDTGEIVDDAQGYGYKTAAGAHRAYGYKSMPKSRKRKIASVKERARRFREDNPSFVDDFGVRHAERVQGRRRIHVRGFQGTAGRGEA